MRIMHDSVKAYLNEISRYPLLTPAQEIELSRQVDAMQALRDVHDPTPAQKRVIKRGERAKRDLINSNLRLVVHLAKQYTHRLSGTGLELMDLVQEGAFGLTRAVELFDSTKGYKFSTYAYWWVRQAITRGIDTKERLIRVPQHSLETVYKATKFQKTFMQQHGRLPSLQEMAEAVEAEPEHLRMLLARNVNHCSLDTSAVEDGSNMIDLIADESSATAQRECMERDEKAAMLRVGLACLSEAELYTISRRYGLNGGEPRSMPSIAAEDGVSRERVRQRLECAHNKMRFHLSKARLQ